MNALDRAWAEYARADDDLRDSPAEMFVTFKHRLANAREAVERAAQERLVAEKNAVYSERNKTVAALAFMAVRAGFKAGTRQHEGDEWDADWRTVLFIDLPTGQVSWHFHDSEVGLLKGLPEYDGVWDGHNPEEKYARLGMFRS